MTGHRLQRSDTSVPTGPALCGSEGRLHESWTGLVSHSLRDCVTLVVLCGLVTLLAFPGTVQAQPERLPPIGGITFEPPRPAQLRRKSGNVLRGHLLAISPKQVHFRTSNGREFQYDLPDVRSVSTVDGEFLFNIQRNTYAEAVEQARALDNVFIDGHAATAGRGGPRVAVELPRPPVPPVALVITPPQRYVLSKAATSVEGPATPLAVAPVATSANIQTRQEVWSQPWFKGGVMIAAIVVILFWWRHKVG